MKTDSDFKILFKKHAAELLALTGDSGARVLNVDSVEVRALRRAVDCVMSPYVASEVVAFRVRGLGGREPPAS